MYGILLLAYTSIMPLNYHILVVRRSKMFSQKFSGYKTALSTIITVHISSQEHLYAYTGTIYSNLDGKGTLHKYSSTETLLC